MRLQFNFLLSMIISILLSLSSIVYSSVQNRIKIFDIIITEIMVDPFPEIGLPGCEYIEIYNPRNIDIILTDLSLVVGTKQNEIPVKILKAKEYNVLCPLRRSYEFKNPEICIEITGFPTLSNSGQSVSIINSNGEVICFVLYEKSWYNDAFKAQGGWSIEMIDTNNPCGCYSNWSASQSLSGGSPGQVNSINGFKPDMSEPVAKRISVIEKNTIKLYFSEPMNKISLVDISTYSINGIKYEQLIINPIGPDFSIVEIILPFLMNVREIYNLNIGIAPVDCVGKAIIRNNDLFFTLPEKPGKNDVIINEILFDPGPGGSEFVEFYNRSQKCIDLSDLYLTKKEPGMEKVYPLYPTSYLLFSGEYILITDNTREIINKYICLNPDRLININNLPSLPDTEGELYLINRWEEIVDNVQYSEKMHHPLINNPDGISIERISPDVPSSELSNWHSASMSAGFASPGYINSQSLNYEKTYGTIELSPEVFSPDNNGYHDVLKINYDFGQIGFSGKVIIYDANGRSIKEILNNGLFGNSGSFFWDGTNSNGKIVPAGIYIVYFEVFDLFGNVNKYKKCCVLAI